MVTREELDAMDRRIQRAGAANCWTGTAGSVAADARRLVRHIREGGTMVETARAERLRANREMLAEVARHEKAREEWERQFRGPALPRPRILGLTGPAGSGKDLVASMIPGRWVVGFADPLYAGLAAILGVPEQMLRDRARKELPLRCVRCADVSPRRLLQTLGTDWGRRLVGEGFWIERARARWDWAWRSGASVVVPDVRFANEAEAIREAGGEIWMVWRPDVEPVEAHESETGIPLRLIDRLIVNSGSVDRLRERVAATLAGRPVVSDSDPMRGSAVPVPAGCSPFFVRLSGE